MVGSPRSLKQQPLLARQIIYMIRRFKKRYASLHNQERKAFIFPNTPHCSLSLPVGMKVCKSLSEFKVKNIKGGFRRRPELIAQRSALSTCGSHSTGEDLSAAKSAPNTERIQYELVVTSLKLLCDIKFSCSTNSSQTFNVLDLDNHEKGMKCLTSGPRHPLIVDIGCGRGYSLKPLTDMGYACTGIDLDMSGLQETKMNLLSSEIITKPQETDRNSTKLAIPSGRTDDLFNSRSLECPSLQPGTTRVSHTVKTMLPDSRHCDACSLNCRRVQHLTPASDVVRWDLRHGLPFKPNSFDWAVSISFLQWLFYGNTKRQLERFFAGLQSVLCPGGKAVIQFYPQNILQLERAIQYAVPYFQGVLIGDYPHLDRGRKLFLLLASLPEFENK